MARWKARIRLRIRHNWTFFASSYRWGTTRQNVSRVAAIRRGVWVTISGGRSRPWGIFFGFYKTRQILLSDSVNCTVLRAVVLTQYRRVTDGQTDGRRTDRIAIASTALAMGALRHAVKMAKLPIIPDHSISSVQSHWHPIPKNLGLLSSDIMDWWHIVIRQLKQNSDVHYAITLTSINCCTFVSHPLTASFQDILGKVSWHQ